MVVCTAFPCINCVLSIQIYARTRTLHWRATLGACRLLLSCRNVVRAFDDVPIFFSSFLLAFGMLRYASPQIRTTLVFVV